MMTGAGESPGVVAGGDSAAIAIESSFEDVAQEWDALADRVSAPPHLRAAWFRAWHAAFGTGSPALVTLRRAGRLAAVLPLERGRGAARAMANYHSPGFAAVAEDAEAVAAVCEGALPAANRSITLKLVDEGGPAAVAAVRSADNHGWRVLREVTQRTPVIHIREPWEDYLGGRDRDFRKELRRLGRRLDELGEVSFEITDGRDGLEDPLEEVFRVEGSSWKLERNTAIVSQPETRQFYTDVATWASGQGMLRLLILRLDGRAVAVDFALEAHGVRYMLKGGFDDGLGRVAPGVLLLAAGLEQAFAANLDTVELGGGDDAYKLRWTSELRPRERVQLFARGPLGLSEWFAYAVGRPLAQRASSRLRGRRR
jgi:CelD/BcsL family acetyltransferase involved in cellulose biosynthesis